MSGRLYIIATPIGNLQDLTDRAKEALSQCDAILAEDTRVSVKLLNHLGLRKSLISCHQFNESKRLEKLEELATEGKVIGVISDAGTPLISDPGQRLVQKAIELDMDIVPIPGPSAFLLAVVASGLPCDKFVFEGFLPEKTSQRKRHLEKLKLESRTLIFYVSPHDQEDTLSDILEVLGDRQVCLARELTKKHEEFLRLPLMQLLQKVQAQKLRGECVLVVQGAPELPPLKASAKQVWQELQKCLADGKKLKQAAGELALTTGWSKSEIYRLGIEHREDGKN